MDLSVSETNKYILEKEEYLESLRALDFLEEMIDDTSTNAWVIAKHQFKIVGSKYFLEYTPSAESVRWKKSALCLLDWEDLVEENLLHVISGAKRIPFEDVMEGCPEEIKEQIIFHLELLEERVGNNNHAVYLGGKTNTIGTAGNVTITAGSGNFPIGTVTSFQPTSTTAVPIRTMNMSDTSSTAANPCQEITLTGSGSITISSTCDTTGAAIGDIMTSTDGSTFIKLS